MNKLRKNQIGNYICAFMCLLVLITQFLPFWNCTNCRTHKEEDKVVSVAETIRVTDERFFLQEPKGYALQVVGR